MINENLSKLTDNQTGWINISPLAKTYLLEEFWQLPEPPDGAKLELIAGVLFMTPPPEPEHDNIVSFLIDLLTEHRRLIKDNGKLYVPRAALWTGPNTYLEPDLFYISSQLEASLDPQHRTTADLVIEVLSPGSAVYDRTTKADTYALLGVKELWLIDEANHTVEVRNHNGQGFGVRQLYRNAEIIVSTVFPTLNLSVERIFQN